MEDVAQQDEGKQEIQGNWSEEEIAALKEENLRLKESKRLADELCALLSNHCGETGENEGAVDTLKRKLSELGSLNLKVRGLEHEDSRADEMFHRAMDAFGADPKPSGKEKLCGCGGATGWDRRANHLVEKIGALRSQKDAAYAERNQVLALLARMALALGWKVGVGQHPVEDATWEKDWRTILFVELPTGQCSWHYHDSEAHLLSGLPAYEGTWDGHTTPEKYDRVNHALRGGVAQVVESGGAEEVAARERAGAERFLPPLSLLQHEEILNGFSSSVHGAAAREAYMKRHGLVYVEGVLHWQVDQTPTNPECQSR